MPETNLKRLDPKLIRRYNTSGPRYTSYPTALQFGEFHESDLIEAINISDNKDKDLSLYIHIPFCATLCYYCACNKIVTRKREPAIEYLALLKKELSLAKSLFKNRYVSQLHWGGGTPTYFDDEQISELMTAIEATFSMRPDTEREFSIEIDPRTVNADRIKNLRNVGFNRLSMGIQDFDITVQKAVNRIQSFSDTKEVILAAREQGFKSISVDLIYGLPHQTLKSFDTTLDLVIKLSPDRISIYNYAHLPERFYPQKRILVSDLPASEEKLNILQLCIEKLCGTGYIYIGMDHFALPDDELALAQKNGSLQRNFQGYSTQAESDMIAFGITAISHIGNTFSQNLKDVASYKQKLELGELPLEKGVLIDDDDLIRKQIIKSLICQFSLNFSKIEQQFGIDFKDNFHSELERLRSMEKDALLEISKTEVVVSPQGRLLIRNICMVFDRHLSG
ncbi:MAG: oxygen-independent coproporphyrinogen-3 oxidase, partial [Candidatus Azotimanducaceae bacterium]